MKLHRAALRALEACEARDKALAHRETLWRPTAFIEGNSERAAAYAAWSLAQDHYIRAYNQAVRLLDEYRRVRLESEKDERIEANNQAEAEQRAPE